MAEPLNLCIIKPNKNAFSETFIQEHINRLPGNKKVLYGGAFPVYDHEGKYLIRSKFGLLVYLIQKRLFKQQSIDIRTKALANYLMANNINVVLAEYGTTGAMVTDACKLADIPLVIHFHGADAHHQPTIKTYYKLYQKAFAYTSSIVAVSNDMVNALKSLGAPNDKITLNPYGVDTEKFTICDINNSAINYLAVGRFVPKKLPISTVKAFQTVLASFPQAHLTMVGTGALYAETVQYAADNGLANNITFTGILPPDQIQALMQKTRCFVQHSVTGHDGDMEGTPNTILEAGSSGLAIVSTQHAGIKDAVINGQTGYLVPEHDIDGMAKYMLKFAADVSLAAQMGQKQAAHIRKNYDIHNRINILSQILNNAIKQHVKKNTA